MTIARSASADSGSIASLAALRSGAAQDPRAAIKAAAQQFEALFMQQLMKSMRDSTMAAGLTDNAGTKLGTELLDTQLATKMTGLPGGLGDLIARQLERQMTGVQSTVAASAASPAGAPAGSAADGSASAQQAAFIARHQDDARRAEAQSGIPGAFIVAQAAHESAWGRREIRNADGSASHNLFGIKAGPGWTGAVAEVTTTEYVGGAPQKVTARFRSYPSYAAAFEDYARMISESPRYAGVLADASAAPTPRSFAQGLQRAGYATDPAYADKLTRVINTTLRLQRVTT